MSYLDILRTGYILYRERKPGFGKFRSLTDTDIADRFEAGDIPHPIVTTAYRSVPRCTNVHIMQRIDFLNMYI